MTSPARRLFNTVYTQNRQALEAGIREYGVAPLYAAVHFCQYNGLGQWINCVQQAVLSKHPLLLQVMANHDVSFDKAPPESPDGGPVCTKTPRTLAREIGQPIPAKFLAELGDNDSLAALPVRHRLGWGAGSASPPRGKLASPGRTSTSLQEASGATGEASAALATQLKRFQNQVIELQEQVRHLEPFKGESQRLSKELDALRNKGGTASAPSSPKSPMRAGEVPLVRLFTVPWACSMFGDFSADARSKTAYRSNHLSYYEGQIPGSGPAVARVRLSSRSGSGDGVAAWNDAQLEFVREIAVLQSLRHQHIVPLFGFAVNDQKLVTIYLGSQTPSLASTLETLNEVDRLRVAIGVGLALERLHSERIAHSKVKTTNVFLDANGNARLGGMGILLSRPGSSSTPVSPAQRRGSERSERPGRASSPSLSGGGTGDAAAADLRESLTQQQIEDDKVAYGLLLLELLTERRGRSYLASRRADIDHPEPDRLAGVAVSQWSTPTALVVARVIQRLLGSSVSSRPALATLLGDLEKSWPAEKVFLDITDASIGRCIMCLAKPATVARQPCMHKVVCKACLPLLHGRRCPICRVELLLRDDLLRGSGDLGGSSRERRRSDSGQTSRRRSQSGGRSGPGSRASSPMLPRVESPSGSRKPEPIEIVESLEI